MRDEATDDEMVALIRGIWSGRTDRYSELRAEGGAGGRKVEMYQIGG